MQPRIVKIAVVTIGVVLIPVDIIVITTS